MFVAPASPRRLALLASLAVLVTAGCQTTSPTTGTPGISYGDAKAVEASCHTASVIASDKMFHAPILMPAPTTLGPLDRRASPFVVVAILSSSSRVDL